MSKPSDSERANVIPCPLLHCKSAKSGKMTSNSPTNTKISFRHPQLKQKADGKIFSFQNCRLFKYCNELLISAFNNLKFSGMERLFSRQSFNIFGSEMGECWTHSKFSMRREGGRISTWIARDWRWPPAFWTCKWMEHLGSTSLPWQQKLGKTLAKRRSCSHLWQRGFYNMAWVYYRYLYQIQLLNAIGNVLLSHIDHSSATRLQKLSEVIGEFSTIRQCCQHLGSVSSYNTS